MRTPIRILSEDVSNKIAAGEVIERPASIVKELVENAIDAGATRVSVEVKGGGKELIRVVDDGSGIPAEQAHLAFMRHATSKIYQAEDLVSIGTLGFRGEALPSIASVSKVEFLTRTADADDGVLLEVQGDRIRSSVCGAPPGTQVTVRDLFYNTPARFKFLKSDTAERRAIAEFLTAAALAHPQIAFRLTLEGRQTMQTPGSGNLKEAIAAVYGRSILADLISVEWQEPWGGVFGYVGKPRLAKGNRSTETVFVNGRWVQNRLLFAAVERGYEALLPQRRFPMAVLHIAIDPTLIDVNVHPAKTEIRFRDERAVFAAVMRATRSALVGANLVSHLGQPVTDERVSPAPPSSSAPVPAGDSIAATGESPAADLKSSETTQTRLSWSGLFAPEKKADRPAGLGNVEWVGESRSVYPAPGKVAEPPTAPTGSAASPWVSRTPEAEAETMAEGDRDGIAAAAEDPAAARMPAAHERMPLSQLEAERAREQWEKDAFAYGFDPREYLATAHVLGQLAGTYILVPVPSGLWLIDQHVAHERILFEAVLAGSGDEETAAQELLAPHTVTLSPSLASSLVDHLDELATLGFHVEAFGGNDFLVRAVPVAVGRRPAAALVQIVEDLAAVVVEGGPSQRERAAASIACRGAIKAGERLSPEAMRNLLRRLATVENPYACPHGRPIIVQLSLTEIARRFGRS